MKKTVLLTMAFFVVFLFCGCGQYKYVKNINIVTACSAKKIDDKTEYSFFVSRAVSDLAEESGGITTELYNIYCEDYATAVELCEERVGELDFSHLGIFLCDVGYISDSFSGDLDNIIRHIKISPLVKFFVNASDSETILDSINSKFGANMTEFVEIAYSGNNKNLLCTFSEVKFAHINSLYTASIPVLNIDENGLVTNNSTLFYSSSGGCSLLVENDHDVYQRYIKKYGKSSEVFDLKVTDNGLQVKISGNPDEQTEMSAIAEKYKEMGFDILNVFFHAKKCFVTYKRYYLFAQHFNMYNIHFV